MIGLDRARSIAQRYGETRVVLSFGAADGGALFAQWLRVELMKLKGYREPNNVYLDTVALSQVPGTELRMREIRPTAGGLASMNEGWTDYYRYAVSMAHTMVFVATKAWYRSPYCGNELKWYIAENQERRQGGRRSLRGLALTFPEEGGLTVFGGMRSIRARKKYAVDDPRKRMKLSGNYRDFWMVDDASLRELSGEIE
jgi:hypothetical protein